MIFHSDKFIADIQKRIPDILVLTPQDKRRLYLAQGEIMMSSVQRQFGSIGRRFLNHAWSPLAKSTKRAYKKRGYNPKPTLRRTGTLFNSLQITLTAEGPVLGTNVEYAEYLQFGTRNMSPRPFLPMRPFQKSLLPQDIEAIRNITIKAYELKVKNLQ